LALWNPIFDNNGEMNMPNNPYTYVFLLFAIINLVGFVITGIDKYKASRSLWRIHEGTFFWLVLMAAHRAYI